MWIGWNGCTVEAARTMIISASVDIGAYDTCLHGCAYCYATTSAALCARRHAAHDPDSPLLVGCPKGTETIIDRL